MVEVVVHDGVGAPLSGITSSGAVVADAVVVAAAAGGKQNACMTYNWYDATRNCLFSCLLAEAELFV